jgi:hypothetical protein
MAESRHEEHLRLLTIFHYVVAGLAALFACFPLLHLSVGIAMVTGALGNGDAGPPAAFGWFFVIVSAVFILGGWALAGTILYGGRCLARRRRYTACQVVAGVECILMPFGTVLGVLTLVKLSEPEVRALFADAPDEAGEADAAAAPPAGAGGARGERDRVEEATP